MWASDITASIYEILHCWVEIRAVSGYTGDAVIFETPEFTEKIAV